MLLAVIAALAAVVLALWIRWRRSKFQFFQKIGIPGPKPGILFGNMWEIYNKDPLQCTGEWLQKYGKVIGYYNGIEPVLLVTDLEILKQVLVKKFNSFTDRANLFSLTDNRAEDVKAPHLVNRTGQQWKELRSLLSPTFTTGKLKKMAPLMNSAMEEMVGKIDAKAKSGEDFEIFNLYKGLTMDVIGRTAFGIEAHIQDKPSHPLLRTAKIIVSQGFKSPLLLFGFSFSEFRRIFAFLKDLTLSFKNEGVNPTDELLSTCHDVLRMRRENNELRRPDLLQTMIDTKISAEQLEAAAEGEGSDDEAEMLSIQSHKTEMSKLQLQLSDKEIIGNAFLFFLAGYESTSTALSFSTHFLVNKQDIQDKLRQEIFLKIAENETVDYDSVQKLTYMDMFIMECFRMYPPVYSFVNRLSTQEVQLEQWTFPKDMVVQIPVYFLHRDPDFWPNPERFNPDRFLPENRSPNHSMIWQPFGAGPRNCIGMRFALLEIKLALTRILSKYRLLPSPRTETEGNLELNITQLILSPKNGIFIKAVAV